MSHYEERLEKDLEAIRGRIHTLAVDVGVAIDRSVRSILTMDRDLASETILQDLKINREVRELDRLSHLFVARHLPSAGHLRFVSAVLRLLIALERVGDHAVTICRETVQLSVEPSQTVARDIEMMADQARSVLRQAMKAFEGGNAELAKGTMGMADQLASSFDKIFDDLVRDAKKKPENIEDSFAQLVVLNRLERVSDQAKNVCEETVFYATGETKAPKIYRVLFLDQHNDCASQMAEHVARKSYPGSGKYASAGWEPAAELRPELAAFMDGRGFDLGEARPDELKPIHDELADYHVIVDLIGTAREHVPEVPFHTVLLRWELPDSLRAASSEAEFEQLHAELAPRVRALMETLRGEDAP